MQGSVNINVVHVKPSESMAIVPFSLESALATSERPMPLPDVF